MEKYENPESDTYSKIILAVIDRYPIMANLMRYVFYNIQDKYLLGDGPFKLKGDMGVRRFKDV